ncbi:MAG: SCO family protein, partial [Nitrospinales bacterium]|jgi:protein SCO1/2|nr:SCO family protein [Nitrospinales bacterium]
MKRNFTWTIVSCLAVMLIALSLYVNKMTTKVYLSNEQLKDLGLYLIDPARNLGSFNLIDSSGKEFLPQDFEGKWNVLFFGFTFCPDICPITMRMLSRIEKEIDSQELDKIRIFLVTVDPDRDSPDQLKVYLENFSENFIGLTGGLDQIYNFATRVNAPFSPISNSKDPHYTVDHTGSIVLIDPNGNYAGFFRAPHNQDKIKKGLLEIIRRDL